MSLQPQPSGTQCCTVVAVVLVDNKVKMLVVHDPLLLVVRRRIAIEEASDIPIHESLLQLQTVHELPKCRVVAANKTF